MSRQIVAPPAHLSVAPPARLSIAPPARQIAAPPARCARAVRRHLVLAFLAGALLGFAADGRADDADGDDDPLEGYNRVMFEINRTIDGLLLKPAAQFYVTVLPHEVRYRISNVLYNLGEPINLLNNVAQGKMERAGTTFMRFSINSTVGLVGIFDVAGEWGYERASEDFGQTLASWGVGGDPFLMLPLLGPSNPRDAAGFAVDWAADPLGYMLPSDAGLARSITSGVSQRAEHLKDLETVERTSIDFYTALRELYRQYRANEIRDGAPPPAMAVPDFDFDGEWPEE